jgi:peptidoglycan/xylan/chitin deacetylase (PgdA/CDA1 family)
MVRVSTVVAGLLAGTASALPSPLDIFRRQGGGVITQCNRSGVIALAYDDGPYQYTSELIDILDAAGAKATFFWTGTLYGCIYNQAAAVKKAYASGHQIASHTWSHPQGMGSWGSDQISQEMNRLDQAFANLVGVKPAYVRPPYLDTGGQFLPTMSSLGYTAVTMDIDSQDWNGASASQSESYFQNAGTSGNGHIPLMHETYASTVQQLTPWVIQWAKSAGLELVTVADCLGAEPYQQTGLTGNGQNSC